MAPQAGFVALEGDHTVCFLSHLLMTPRSQGEPQKDQGTGALLPLYLREGQAWVD